MDIVDGAFLLCPVSIMPCHQVLWATLLTTAVLVITLSLLLAATLDSEFNVLAGSAAYAEVLVVFVKLSVDKSRAGL